MKPGSRLDLESLAAAENQTNAHLQCRFLN